MAILARLSFLGILVPGLVLLLLRAYYCGYRSITTRRPLGTFQFLPFQGKAARADHMGRL